MGKRIVVQQLNGITSIQGTTEGLKVDSKELPIEISDATGAKYSLTGVFPKYVLYKELEPAHELSTQQI